MANLWFWFVILSHIDNLTWCVWYYNKDSWISYFVRNTTDKQLLYNLFTVQPNKLTLFLIKKSDWQSDFMLCKVQVLLCIIGGHSKVGDLAEELEVPVTSSCNSLWWLFLFFEPLLKNAENRMLVLFWRHIFYECSWSVLTMVTNTLLSCCCFTKKATPCFISWMHLMWSSSLKEMFSLH